MKTKEQILGMSKETTLKIKIVGNYMYPMAESTDCKICGNADWGDVIIEDICGKCLLHHRDTTVGLYAMDKDPNVLFYRII